MAGSETVDIRVAFPGSGGYSLKVYNSAGEYITTLAPDQSVTGPFDQTYSWNGTNSLGENVASGTYVITLVEPFGVHTARVMVI
jgi:flagellar hook assembly protein FlgD